MSRKIVEKLICLSGQLRNIHIDKTGVFALKMTQKCKNNHYILQNLSPTKGTLLKSFVIDDYALNSIFLPIPSLDNAGDSWSRTGQLK